MYRVLHLIWRIEGGGIEQFCINVLSNIDSEEFSFDFVVCGDKCAGEVDDRLNRSTIYHFPQINGRDGKKKYLNALRRLLESTEYDVVHSHLAFMNISTLKIAKECGVPTRISHTHVAGFGSPNSLSNIVKRILMNFYATSCFACSYDTAAFYYGKKSRKARILYSGVDVQRFNIESEKNQNRFIVIARVCPEKNPDFILKVAEKLAEKNPKLQFHWYGGGIDLPQLMEEATMRKNPFVFHGQVSNIEDYLKNAAYMLMPSQKEGFGMAAVEAQLSGTFVFASDRVPRDTDLGMIQYFPLDSPEAWAERILESIKGDIVKKHGLLKEKVEKYDIQRIVKELSEVYKRKC